jgi:hypothetical protein
MGRIFAAIEEFLQTDHWPVTVIDERMMIKTGFNGDHGEFSCYAQAREEQEQFVFYSVFPVKISVKDHAAVTEFITRANYGMIIGNFELDLSDGEVRYKTSVDLEGVEIQSNMLRNLMYANVLTMDKYFTGLMRVIYGGITAQEAIQEIEG